MLALFLSAFTCRELCDDKQGVKLIRAPCVRTFPPLTLCSFQDGGLMVPSRIGSTACNTSSHGGWWGSVFLLALDIPCAVLDSLVCDWSGTSSALLSSFSHCRPQAACMCAADDYSIFDPPHKPLALLFSPSCVCPQLQL